MKWIEFYMSDNIRNTAKIAQFAQKLPNLDILENDSYIAQWEHLC